MLDYLLRYIVPMVLVLILAAYWDPRPSAWPRTLWIGFVSVVLFLLYMIYIAPLIPVPER